MLQRFTISHVFLIMIKLFRGWDSSVVRGKGGGGGWRGAIVPPIGMSTKMQNEKNTTFLALLRLLNALEWTK